MFFLLRKRSENIEKKNINENNMFVKYYTFFYKL